MSLAYEDFEEHIEDIQDEFAERMEEKYRKGQIEHGGSLWEMDADGLLENAIDEAVDMVVYLLTLKRQREASSADEN